LSVCQVVALMKAVSFLVLLVPQLWLAGYSREDDWIPILATCLSFGLLAPQEEIVFIGGHLPLRTKRKHGI
jgi:hypothetical protein